jgi:hypothetical protein
MPGLRCTVGHVFVQHGFGFFVIATATTAVLRVGMSHEYLLRSSLKVQLKVQLRPTLWADGQLANVPCVLVCLLVSSHKVCILVSSTALYWCAPHTTL